MAKNKKGFMLVEVIVTSTVILTAMIFLFSSFNSLFSKYKERETYHDLDGFYAAKETIKYLQETNLNEFINKELIEKSERFYFIKNNEIYCKTKECDDTDKKYDDEVFFSKLKELYNIQNLVITTYDKKNLENMSNEEENQNETLKEYINYVINYYNIQNENIYSNNVDEKRKNEYTYIVLIETKNENNMGYASIAIR